MLLVVGMVMVWGASAHAAPKRLTKAALEALILPALEAQLDGCTYKAMKLPRRLRVPAGKVTLQSLRTTAPTRTGRMALRANLKIGKRQLLLPVSARVSCPPPAVEPGQTLSLVLRRGAVRLKVPGEARQPGRIGQVIRVTNSLHRNTLQARILSSELAEVVQ